MRYVIVGTGVAGMAAIEAIRLIDTENEIMMIGDDPHGFYSRPGLAYFLTGELHDKALYPRTSEDYRRMNFRFASARVTGVLRDVHQLELDSQKTLAYD